MVWDPIWGEPRSLRAFHQAYLLINRQFAYMLEIKNIFPKKGVLITPGDNNMVSDQPEECKVGFSFI